MSRRITAAIAAVSLALGILVGAAGSVVIREATTLSMRLPAQAAAMQNMHQAMSALMGTGMSSHMVDFIGGGMVYSETGPMGPGSGIPVHRQHHPDWP